MTRGNARLDLTRSQILAFRRHVGALDRRLPPGPQSLRRAAWAGLQDSMPRAALLSIHARVEGTGPSAWEDPSLVQLWGPRFSVFVVGACDLAVFSLGTMPDDAKGRRRAEELAADLAAAIGTERTPHKEAGSRLGVDPNRLRYAAATGTVLIRWEGARQPTVWMVPAPELGPREARLELARRYLHSYGPTTPQSFGEWSGIGPRSAAAAFSTLGESLTPVRSPIGDAWILGEDEGVFRTEPGPTAPARLLPSGDSFSCSRGPTGNSWCRTRIAGASSGRRASGRARSWSTARSRGRGGERARCSRCSAFGHCPALNEMRSRRRRPPCRCLASRDRLWSAGTKR